ncbi:MAG: lactonase family protein [Planctomycetota bacterium]|jgi:6-phosphogluconolactonase
MPHVNLNRRDFVKATTLTGAVALTGCATTERSCCESNPQNFWVYVGTYTRKNSKGVYRFDYDTQTGALSNGALVAETENPSFLALHPNGRWLYAVNETSDFGGQNAGGIRAYRIDPATGDLDQVGQARSTHGASPCYVSVDPSGSAALVANYNGGNLAVFPIGADGSLAEAAQVVQHRGSSVNPRRQGEPHAHSILPDTGSNTVLAADLGVDKVIGYRFDPAMGKLVGHEPSTVKMTPGAGPRHVAFGIDGRHAYAINELDSTLTTMDFNRATGKLQKIQTLSTLPEGFTDNNSCADVHLHPNGRFLYGSNRGHNSIAIFAVDAVTGRLSPRGHASTRGSTPRNFGIDPTGRFLLATNQNSDTIASFAIDTTTGALTHNGAIAEAPTPVCILFVPRGG